MKKIFNIIILFAMVLPFGCKKYPDGPCFSLRSSKNRVTGTWRVDKFYMDGADSTEEYYQKLGCKIEFSGGGGGITARHAVKLSSCNNYKSLNGRWYFEHNNYLNIRYYGIEIAFYTDTTFHDAIGPFGNSRACLWKILRLTNTEFNLTSGRPHSTPWDPRGTTYLIELKK